MAERAQTTPEGINFGDEGPGKDIRQMCKYGENCYQKNPMHHQKFRHPSKEKTIICPDKTRQKVSDDLKENNGAGCNTTKNVTEPEETDMGPPATKKLKTSNQKEDPNNEKEVFCFIFRNNYI